MQENEENTGSDKVLILPLSEGSKKITQILSNDRAMKVLEILTDMPMSATDVAEKMGTPLTTIKYNIDALVEADLIKVKQTKWSKKGREIKIYEPVQKIIVVAPGSMKGDKSSILDMLKKYLVLAGGAIFAATGLEILTNKMGFGAAPMASSFQSTGYQENMAPMINEDLPEAASGEASIDEALKGKSAPAEEEAIAYDAIEEEMPEADYFDETVMDEPVEEFDYEITEAPPSDDTLIPREVDSETVSSAIPQESIDSGADVIRDGFNSSSPGQVPMAGESQAVADSIPLASQPFSGLIPHDLLSHSSVWFLFGCLFVIALLFIREVYYRKKEI
ncbi:helix-turn-helix domain-containing protein [Methanolobus sp. ZRKC2]|uniref:ArsR/SmtB family transcription factor n=1 Tax=Methanolobus sp. ZRKC2 TaxID=3125783 RepID=UPI0032503DE9